MNEEEFGKKFQDEYKSFAQENGKCNAMVIGVTGVGKSTLINAVFGFSTAKAGAGKPVTEEIREHSHPKSPITIYDTPGLEVDEAKIKRTKEDVVNLIANKRKQDANEHIHFVWYCINEKSNRFQDVEEEWIKDIVKQEVLVIIVLTQTQNPKRSKLLDYIKELNLPVNDVIPVLAEPDEITDDFIIPAYGLENLIEVTASLFPQQAKKASIAAEAAAKEAERKFRIAAEAAEKEKEAETKFRIAAEEAETKFRIAAEEARKARIAQESEERARAAFISAQQVIVDLKISEAEKYLKHYVAGAALAGSPISGFFGGLAVAGVQTGMIAHLTYICGLEFNNSFLFPIYAACASVSFPTLIAVSIPGVDGVAGASAAGIMTYLMGKALLFGYKQYLKAQKAGKEMSKSELSKIIIDIYKKYLREGTN